MPQLGQLEREFPGQVVVIGVHSAKFPAERITENVRAAVARYDVEHPVVNDGAFDVWNQYAVRAWPTLMFVDPSGRVWGKHEGEATLDTLREIVREALADYARDVLHNPAPVPVEIPELTMTTLRYPGKVIADAGQSRLIVSDSGHHRVLVTDLDGKFQQVVGSSERGFADGPMASATFNHPEGLALAPDGAIFVADRANHAIRRIDPTAGTVTTVAGTGVRAPGYPDALAPGIEVAIASPWDLMLVGDELWIAMAGLHQVWTLNITTGLIGRVAGTGVESIHDDTLPNATFAQPSGITALDGMIYTADSETSSVRRIDPVANRVRRLVGRGLFDFGDVDGGADVARLQHPLGILATHELNGPALYVADTYNHKIKRLDPETRTVATIAGTGEAGHMNGAVVDATFWEPSGLTILGRILYVSDTNNHAIRAIDLDGGTVTTVNVMGER